MLEIKNLLASPTFWFASVLLAFLMSFFASYTKDWSDKWFLRRAKKKDAEAERRQQHFTETVTRLKNCPALLALYQSNIVYQKLRQVLYLMVSYVFMALSFYSAVKFEIRTALIMLISAGLIGLFPLRSVSRQLHDLRSIVNAALEDGELHFVG